MKLTLGFSPCPNDTFIFDALIHHKIDTEGLDFEVFFEDVETLNQKALQGQLDITKLSFHAFAHALANYALLDAGSALGFGVGPLLVCRRENTALVNSKLQTPKSDLAVGIPGIHTTANFLLSIAYPQLHNKKILVFSEIEEALLQNEIDLGLIIHENRFTYQNKGLHQVVDLGNYWEKLTGCAIPLGGVAVNRKLPQEIQEKINRLVGKSVKFAFKNPKSGLAFIRSHAQEMDETVMYQHINLYVNQYSVNLGANGRKAINSFFIKAKENQIIPHFDLPLYVNKNNCQPKS